MKNLTALATLLIALFLCFWEQEEKKKSVNITLPNKQSRSLASPPPSKSTVPQASNKAVRSVIDPRDRLVKELEKLDGCYASEDCAFPQTDPRSYEVALGKRIAQKLSAFRTKYPKDERGLKLARRFMQSGDGFVQEEALKLLSNYPISQESLSAITTGLTNTPDAPLMKHAIGELKRYIGSAYEPVVHTFLSSTLASGAHFTAETVSEDISPFINQSSYSKYKNASDTIPAGATAKRNLNSALREYRRVTTGA